MPIFGAVLVLNGDPTLAAAAMESLERDPRITIGERDGNLVPLAIETRSREEAGVYWKALAQLPGAVNVQLAYADFSDLHDPTENPS